MAQSAAVDARARQALADGARDLGLALSAAAGEKLLKLIDLVAQANERMNLTAIAGPLPMVTKHLLDSLSVVRFLKGERIADLGTGAGFPGLPLAIVCPTLRFLLIEATAKKLAFVREVSAALALRNVELLAARAERVVLEERCATVVARAFGPLKAICLAAAGILAADGRLLAMKGRYPAAELEAVPAGFRVQAVERLSVPGLDAERHLVILGRSP